MGGKKLLTRFGHGLNSFTGKAPSFSSFKSPKPSFFGGHSFKQKPSNHSNKFGLSHFTPKSNSFSSAKFAPSFGGKGFKQKQNFNFMTRPSFFGQPTGNYKAPAPPTYFNRQQQTLSPKDEMQKYKAGFAKQKYERMISEQRSATPKAVARTLGKGASFAGTKVGEWKQKKAIKKAQAFKEKQKKEMQQSQKFEASAKEYEVAKTKVESEQAIKNAYNTPAKPNEFEIQKMVVEKESKAIKQKESQIAEKQFKERNTKPKFEPVGESAS